MRHWREVIHVVAASRPGPCGRGDGRGGRSRRSGATRGTAELRSKTVVLTWNEVRTQRQEKSGEVQTGRTASQLSGYVSGAGRIFSRFSRMGGRRSNQTDTSPDARTREGQGAGEHQIGFEGDRLNIDTKMRAGRTASPSVSATAMAPANSPSRTHGKGVCYRSMDGEMYFIISADVSAQVCAIKDGNVFAAAQ